MMAIITDGDDDHDDDKNDNNSIMIRVMEIKKKQLYCNEVGYRNKGDIVDNESRDKDYNEMIVFIIMKIVVAAKLFF